jgi:N-acetylglucosaminyl-diphospho-decaprenol L-rhamnosyltransferase
VKPNDPTVRTAPIAIVTVTFSPGEYLTRFLDSVPAATSQGAVVVMADNGSTDGAPEAATERDGVELLRTGGNIGYGAGMNAGIEALRARRAAGEIDGSSW